MLAADRPITPKLVADRAYHRVRIGFSAPPRRSDVEEGFARLRLLLDNGIVGYDTYG